MQTGLEHFDKARQALALANTIDEIKEIRDQAEMLRAYAKQSGESLEMQNMCAEIRLRAERRAGELLKEREWHPPGPDKEDRSHDATEPPKLEDIGINKSQSSRWQQMADVPEIDFEKYIAHVVVEEKELTTSGIMRLARDVKEARAKESVVKQPAPSGKYGTIIVDPPWPIQKVLREQRPNQQALDYPTMTLDEIKNIPIIDIAEDDCHLFLWTTQKFLPNSLIILEHWGFRYVLTLVWHKAGGFQPFGLPQYNCEFVVYGRIGKPAFINTKGFPCCFEGARRQHSRKPDEFYEMIRKATGGDRIDYFSRESRSGYAQYGNEQAKFC